MAGRGRQALVLGHSFIARLERYALDLHGQANLGLDRDYVTFHGLPGAQICRIRSALKRIFAGNRYDAVCLQIGGNDLSSHSANADRVADGIIELATCLLARFGVRVVYVCALFERAKTRLHKGDVSVAIYNERVARVNALLSSRLHAEPFIVFWSHCRSIWNEHALLSADGVHFKHMKPYHRSIKSCVLNALSRVRV